MISDAYMALEDGTTRTIHAPCHSQNAIDLKTLRRLGVGKTQLVANFIVKTALTAGSAAAGTTLECELVSTPVAASGAVATISGTATLGTDVITAAAHGLNIGAPVVFTTVVAGITANTIYYVARQNFTTGAFSLTATEALAFTATNTGNGIVDITATGAVVGQGFPTGLVHEVATTDTGDTFAQPSGLVLPNGTMVRVRETYTSTLGVAVDGQVCFVTNSTSSTFTLSTTRFKAMTGAPDVTITTNGTAAIEILPIVLGSSGEIPVQLLNYGAQVQVKINTPTQLGGAPDSATELMSRSVQPAFDHVVARFKPSAVLTAGKIAASIGIEGEVREYYPSALSN